MHAVLTLLFFSFRGGHLVEPVLLLPAILLGPALLLLGAVVGIRESMNMERAAKS